MNEKTRKRVVYTIFALAVLFGLYMKPWERRRSEDNAPTAASVEQSDVNRVTAGGSDSTPTLAVALFATEWPEDPFAHRGQVGGTPIVSTSSDEPNWTSFTLQGMMQLGGQAACVINGEFLKAGDRISGWTVESVSATEAILRLGSERQRLRID